MSKMPAKKKSCFQITSVTQAQVAASNAADDTESLDDPDESRTEDVSSEIFDVSRADLEPGSCERSSSEETLNNVGDPEVAHPPLSHPHPPLLLRPGPVSPAPPNGGFGVRHIEETVVSHMPHTNLQSPGHQTVQQQGPASVSGNQQSLTNSSTTTTTSCSSRFRVIKLDHGTGEPFRRGRWTCTEFYEKDPEGSVISRTVDSIRHPSVTEQTLERDSGLGGSAVPQSGLSGQGAESSAVVGVVVGAPEVHPYDQAHGHGLVVLPSPQHQHQQQQQVPQGPGTVVPDPLGTKPGLIQTGSHVVVPHSLVPPGHNGMQQTVHIQNSPGVVPSPQSQMLAYQTQQQNPQQLPLGHQPGLIPPPAQVEYGHLAVGQGGLSVAQGPSPVPTPVAPVGGGVQALGVPMEMATIPTGVPLPGSQPGIPVPGLITQHGAGLMSGGVASVPQLGQYSSVNTSLGLGVPPNVSSVPVTSASAGMAPGGNTPAHAQQGQVPRNGTTTTVVTGGGLNQTEEGRRKSEGPMQISLAAGKEPGKPLITEELPLPHPAVNSLFGIAIPIDGDDDSASGASVVAIDNKIEQAMDLVKSHLMYAVREEVEVLKEQIKELFERNSVLERENAVLKSLANNDQLSQLSAQTVPAASASAQPQAPPPSQAPPLASLPVPVPVLAPTPPQAQPQPQPMPPPAFQPELSQTLIATAPQHQQQQPSVTSA